MIKLVLPRIGNINSKNSRNLSLFDTLVEEYQMGCKPQCIFDILKLIAPLCDIKMDFKTYPLPIYQMLTIEKRKNNYDIEADKNAKIFRENE